MRPAQKSNRSRGRGNRKSGGGGGGNNINRVFDSAGPEGKVRGTPQQIIDKYVSLARDAQTSGDRVASENFFQHAEHYQRMLTQAMAAQEQARRESEQPETNDQAQPAPIAVSTPVEEPRVNGAGEQPTPKVEEEVARPSKEIGGMATIDPGTDTDTGVLFEDSSNKPEQQNGEVRRKRRKPAPEENNVAPDPAPDLPVES